MRGSEGLFLLEKRENNLALAKKVRGGDKKLAYAALGDPRSRHGSEATQRGGTLDEANLQGGDGVG